MLTDLQCRRLKDILLMPITTIDSGSIEIKDNKIKSTQTYWKWKKYDKPFDPDMSDFSVRFYEVLYSELLNNKKIINTENDGFNNDNFAGDTMNTGVMTNRKTRLECRYRHCLANFWVLPMDFGRKSSKTILNIKTDDYMDKTLAVIEREWLNLQKNPKYKDYFTGFLCFDDFREKHYIPKYEDTQTLDKQIEFIENRAELIIKSRCATELYEYFVSADLIVVNS